MDFSIFSTKVCEKSISVVSGYLIFKFVDIVEDTKYVAYKSVSISHNACSGVLSGHWFPPHDRCLTWHCTRMVYMTL